MGQADWKDSWSSVWSLSSDQCCCRLEEVLRPEWANTGSIRQSWLVVERLMDTAVADGVVFFVLLHPVLLHGYVGDKGGSNA